MIQIKSEHVEFGVIVLLHIIAVSASVIRLVKYRPFIKNLNKFKFNSSSEYLQKKELRDELIKIKIHWGFNAL